LGDKNQPKSRFYVIDVAWLLIDCMIILMLNYNIWQWGETRRQTLANFFVCHFNITFIELPGFFRNTVVCHGEINNEAKPFAKEPKLGL